MRKGQANIAHFGVSSSTYGRGVQYKDSLSLFVQSQKTPLSFQFKASQGQLKRRTRLEGYPMGAVMARKRQSEQPLLPLAYLLNADYNFAKSILWYF